MADAASGGGGGRRWQDEVEPELRPRMYGGLLNKFANFASMTRQPNFHPENLRRAAGCAKRDAFSKATDKMDYCRRISILIADMDNRRLPMMQAAAAAAAFQQQVQMLQQQMQQAQAFQGGNSMFTTATPPAVSSSMMPAPSRPPVQLPNQHMASRFAPNMHSGINQGPSDMMPMFPHNFTVAPTVQPAGQHIMQVSAIQGQNQCPAVPLQPANVARYNPPSMAQLQGQPIGWPNGNQNHLLGQNAGLYVQQLQNDGPYVQQLQPAVQQQQQHLGLNQQQVRLQRNQMLGANVLNMNNGYPGRCNNQQNAGSAAGVQSPSMACVLKKQINADSQQMPPAQCQTTVNQQSNGNCSGLQTPETMGSATEVDWREEMLQQIKSLKDDYFSLLMEFDQKIDDPKLPEEQLKLLPRDAADAYSHRLYVKGLISHVLKFLQFQTSEMTETLRATLPKYQNSIQCLVRLYNKGNPKASNAEMNTKQKSKNYSRQATPQTAILSPDIAPFNGSKSNQPKQHAEASSCRIRQSVVTTLPQVGQKTHSNELHGVTSPCSSIKPPGGLQSLSINNVELCCTPSPIAKSGLLQVNSPEALLKSTSQSTIAKPEAVAAASPCGSVKSTLTSTVEKSGVLAAASPCPSVKSASPAAVSMSGVSPVASSPDSDSSIVLHNDVAVNGCNQATLTKLLTPAPRSHTETSVGQTDDQVHVGAEKPVANKPIDRLLAAVLSSSSAALHSSANSMELALSAMDSVPLRMGSNSKMKRVYDATSPYSESPTLGTDGSTVTFDCDGSDLASSGHHQCVKRQKTQNAKDALLDEIEAINSRLIDTVISVTTDKKADGIAFSNGGTLIKLSYTAVSLSPSLKSHFAIPANDQPLVIHMTTLLVPADYPRNSPVIIDDEGDARLRTKFSCISAAADATFRVALRKLAEPMSLTEMTKAWDTCVRRVITEYACRFGGGTLSSSLFLRESCVGA